MARRILFFVPYFPSRLDFHSPLLSAPRTPRMTKPLSRMQSLSESRGLSKVTNLILVGPVQTPSFS